jgi:4-hydroxy-tetrahydrodipicolinate synthase
VEAAKGRCKVIAGTGSNSTEEAIALTQQAQKMKADGALMVTPYYNKPTPEGLYQHFKAVHDATDIPIILYNIPGRAVVNMDDALIVRLSALPRIVGVKDATGDLARVSTLRAKLGDSFTQLSGEDITVLGFLAQGGKGCISVTSNIAPKAYVAMMRAWEASKPAEALRLHDALVPLHSTLFCETNPGPVKYAAHLLGFCAEEMRLPMVPPAPANREKIRAALAEVGLLEKAAA